MTERDSNYQALDNEQSISSKQNINIAYSFSLCSSIEMHAIKILRLYGLLNRCRYLKRIKESKLEDEHYPLWVELLEQTIL